MRTEDYKRELISIVFAQKDLIFWVTFVIFAGAVLIASFWPATYTASASILVSGKQMTAPNLEALKTPDVLQKEITPEDIASEIEILRSPEVISLALKEISGSYPHVLEGGQEVPQSVVFLVDKSLKTNLIPASNVIRIEYSHRNPKFAAALVNAIMDKYTGHRLQFFQPVTTEVTPKQLGEKMDLYLERLGKNEDALLGLLEASGISSPQEEILDNIKLKKRLEENLNELKSTRIDTKTTLTNLEKALETSNPQYFAFIDSNVLTQLSSKLADLLAERGRVSRVYLPESVLLSGIDEQIDTTFTSLKAEAEALRNNTRRALAAIEEKIATIEAAIDLYDQRNVTMERQIVEAERIRRDSALVQTSLAALSQRKGEVEINELVGVKGGASRFVSIMSRAFPPIEPTFPKPNLVIPLGVLFGLMTGCTLGFLREYFDHTFKNPSDVENFVGIPVLFSLAKPQNAARSTAYFVIIAVLLLAVVGFLLWNSMLKGVFS